MSGTKLNCAILSQGSGAWAFEEHASRLARALWLEISETPGDQNYLLSWERLEPPTGKLFIPWDAIQTAADKRLQAAAFGKGSVPTPKTLLLDTPEDVQRVVTSDVGRQWALKYPVACGGTGHRLLTPNATIREDWPRPYVLQEFIKLERPEVYRLYCVAGAIFGWNTRRYPEGVKSSPWVAHARGARYVHLREPPCEAVEAARAALETTGLLGSFGAVDLLKQGNRWLVLEVGTDGIYNHVDREFDSPQLEQELNRRLAEAFWQKSEIKPWGQFGWKTQVAAVSLGQSK